MKTRWAVVSTSLCWIMLVVGCGATLQVKTWFTDSKNVKEECQQEKSLVRRNSDGQIAESLSILEAQGYLCYSPLDDEAWRTRMGTLSACCDAKGGIGSSASALKSAPSSPTALVIQEAPLSLKSAEQ